MGIHASSDDGRCQWASSSFHEFRQKDKDLTR